MSAPPRLLGISGSLRRESHCTAMLRDLARLLAERATLDVMTLHQVPPYDADLDGEAPPPGVHALKRAITAADALVICSPEYNYGIPGVLKNAIDWASRPGYRSPLKGKPVLIVTSSPGLFGGVRAQAQIRDTLAAALARPVVRQHVAVPAVDKKLVNGRIADDLTVELLQAAVTDLLADIAPLRASAAM